ncbi:protein phosphatase 2C 51-like [Amaranthus tricolor]|uniref:protein phosphatase 2C 51-like n=1 Tax=Amaranthus tricolor TaxID=29722 RepID=UPI002586BE61|nr:protein phosphatase 2C 51-like [Amaranthus tricolor]
MTLNEISLPEGISSSPEHATNTDPQKAKISRRRRVEIQRLKSSCQETKNGVVTPSNEDNYYSQGSTCSGVHGAVSVMGRRREMEDAITVEKDLVSRKYDYFGVYDGHGGSQVAEACRDRMHSILLEEMERCETRMKINGCDEDKENVDWEKVMGKCFARMDEEVGRGGGRADNVEEMTVGSTVVVAVVGREEVVVANCGDSRAVICRNGVAVPLSVDHKPDRPDELARIEDAGGRVINWNGYRVLGVLATSRSIGDYYLKPYVSSIPEVMISKRTEADEFLILATDGLWDVISNEVACQVVRRCLSGRIKPQEIFNHINKISNNRAEVAAVLLADLAIAKGSKDNISVIVVDFRIRRFTCS